MPRKLWSKRKIEVGDKIYVPTHMYLSHGEDDIQGGLATVTRVFPYNDSVFISVKELPGREFNWDGWLKEEQEDLRKKYGRRKAKPDPDITPEFNRWD